jgi:alkylation response protein AidB-like acyl-CoA dehydrogenase
MDFALSTEQRLLRDTVRSYCASKYRFPDRAAGLLDVDAFCREHWRAYASLGWLGVILPEDVGGAGASAIEMAIMMEEFGHHLILEPFVECAVLAPSIIDAAGDHHRAALLPPIIRGETLLVLAHSEAEARGSLSFVGTQAKRRDGGGYVLSGRKSLVLGGGRADTMLVLARTSGAEQAPDGLSLFVLRTDVQGVERRVVRTVDGRDAAEVTLSNVHVPAAALVGRAGAALELVEDGVDLALVGLCAEAVGAMDRVVSMTRDYLRTRRAYGTTLGTFQALQHRLADMLVALELSRAIVHYALAAAESGDRRARRSAASAAKALVGQHARFVGACGIQLHGAMGMSDDFIIGHLFKRLIVIDALFGNSDFHLPKIAFDIYAVGRSAAQVERAIASAPDDGPVAVV